MTSNSGSLLSTNSFHITPAAEKHLRESESKPSGTLSTNTEELLDDLSTDDKQLYSDKINALSSDLLFLTRQYGIDIPPSKLHPLLGYSNFTISGNTVINHRDKDTE